jgi:hypothetical protein
MTVSYFVFVQQHFTAESKRKRVYAEILCCSSASSLFSAVKELRAQ